MYSGHCLPFFFDIKIKKSQMGLRMQTEYWYSCVVEKSDTLWYTGKK